MGDCHYLQCTHLPQEAVTWASVVAAGQILCCKHVCMSAYGPPAPQARTHPPTCLRVLPQHVLDPLDCLRLQAELLLIRHTAGVGGVCEGRSGSGAVWEVQPASRDEAASAAASCQPPAHTMSHPAAPLLLLASSAPLITLTYSGV